MGTPPTPAARLSSSGVPINDGYQTLVAIAAAPTAAFWEKTVTPPPVEGDEPIDTSTMQNVFWHTYHLRKLVKMGPWAIEAAYDPKLYNTILTIVNVATTVTVHWPDASTLAFYGGARSFKPSALQEGNKPMAAIDGVVTNTDPTDCSEESPVYTAGAGTHCY